MNLSKIIAKTTLYYILFLIVKKWFSLLKIVFGSNIIVYPQKESWWHK